MTAESERYFYLNSYSNGKILTFGAGFIFLLAYGSEKVAPYIGVPNFGILLKWFFLVFAACMLTGGIYYLTAHSRMVIARVNGRGMTCFWGPIWKLNEVEIPWQGMKSVYVGMAHKKRMVMAFPFGPYTDMGEDEQVLKVVLSQPVETSLADQIKAINRRLWWDATVEANKEGTELYLREEPVGGYEPLLTQIRKYVEQVF